MALTLQHGVRPAKTAPKYLESNATSHERAFSAIAELIDNAYDPDAASSIMWIDKVELEGKHCLLFRDNGNGMTPDKLHKMCSLGFCEKVKVGQHRPVGQYGNGFKSGSMRLGKEVLVFTKCKETRSVAFLSLAFLYAVNADTILVPVISWRNDNKPVEAEDRVGSLKVITSYSIFRSEAAMVKKFDELQGHPTGTLIIIYDLKLQKEQSENLSNFELDFDSKADDIIDSQTQLIDNDSNQRTAQEDLPEHRKSLRAYCSILFLKPRMHIILRGVKVLTSFISRSLRKTAKDFYKPLWLSTRLMITFGFTTSTDYGMMMYYNNRLIKGYEKIGIQKRNGGIGVVGIVDSNVFMPIHNKQDFEITVKYNTFISALGAKMKDYCKIHIKDGDASPSETRKPDWTWVQCDNPTCQKWRRLPDTAASVRLPEHWFCYMNVDPTHNRCDIDEEPEDEDLIFSASYYKKKRKVITHANQPEDIAVSTEVSPSSESRSLLSETMTPPSPVRRGKKRLAAALSSVVPLPAAPRPIVLAPDDSYCEPMETSAVVVTAPSEADSPSMATTPPVSHPPVSHPPVAPVVIAPSQSNGLSLASPAPSTPVPLTRRQPGTPAVTPTLPAKRVRRPRLVAATQSSSTPGSHAGSGEGSGESSGEWERRGREAERLLAESEERGKACEERGKACQERGNACAATLLALRRDVAALLQIMDPRLCVSQLDRVDRLVGNLLKQKYDDMKDKL